MTFKITRYSTSLQIVIFVLILTLIKSINTNLSLGCVITLLTNDYKWIQQFKCMKNSFATAIQHCSINTPFFCLSSLKPQAVHVSEEDPLQTSEKAAKNTREKRLLCSFLFPPLFLFPALPKVLLGNRSQVFDKPVVDMTAVQSSV